MEQVAVRYASCVLNASDINEHLPTLMRLSVGCGSIAELGVREAVSTWAFLYGLCLNQKEEKTLYCVDLNDPPCLGELRQLTASCGVGFEFFRGDSATTPVPEVDMMFIDTWHVYGHLKRELAFHHARVRKFIVLHDTEVDKLVGESVRDPKHDIDKLSAQYGYPRHEVTMGLSFAVREFLSDHPEWTLKEHHANNNGLTVLGRVG